VPVDPTQNPPHLPEFSARTDALDRCEAERANLVASVRVAAERGEQVIAWQLPCALLNFLYLRKYCDDWVFTHRIALDAATRAGDTPARARVLNGLGVVYSDLGQLAEAVDCHRAATPLFRQLGDEVGEAWNLNNLGVAYDNHGRYDAAADCYREAVPLFRQPRQPTRGEHQPQQPWRRPPRARSPRHGAGLPAACTGDPAPHQRPGSPSVHPVQPR
jgi:tetratricopeptide (TPR) repeat protein